MVSGKISFCPRCRNPVDAKDFYSSGGASDWRVEGVGASIVCPKCGYSGPPAEADSGEFKKAAGKELRKRPSAQSTP